MDRSTSSCWYQLVTLRVTSRQELAGRRWTEPKELRRGTPQYQQVVDRLVTLRVTSHEDEEGGGAQAGDCTSLVTLRVTSMRLGTG